MTVSVAPNAARYFLQHVSMINIHSATKIFAPVVASFAITAVSTLGRTAEMLQVDNASIFYEIAGHGDRPVDSVDTKNAAVSV